MKKFLIPVIIIAFVLLLSCGKNSHAVSYNYTVKVQIGDSLHYDSVSLTMVNDTYSALQHIGTSTVKDGLCEFGGQMTGAAVAYLRLDTLERPFYFVLEPGITKINIDLRKWSIAGGKGNEQYTRLLNERQRLIDERKANRESYLKAIADTTLTLRKERVAVVRDSLLADSLQHLMARCTTGTDAVSRIMRERFGSR